MLYFAIAIYLLSIALQFASSYVSFFLFKRQGIYQYSWILISIALLSMIYRRISSLTYIYETRIEIIADAILSLLISLFIFIGFFGIRRIFLDLEKNNKQLNSQTKIDIMTGAFSHDEGYLRGNDEIARTCRNNKSLGFIMIDIDCFKRINENYGHLAGDFILNKFSQICKKEIRSIDTFCRFGGDEFLVIIPDIDILELNELANRLRIKIEKSNFKYLKEKISLNISAGTSHFDPSINKIKKVNSIFLKYVKRADDAMFIAKAKGRNIVIQWSGN